MVPYCTIWYHIVQYDTILYNMIPYCTIWFEGVCLTHVILAPGACGGGVWAPLPDTTSGGFPGIRGFRGFRGFRGKVPGGSIESIEIRVWAIFDRKAGSQKLKVIKNTQDVNGISILHIFEYFCIFWYIFDFTSKTMWMLTMFSPGSHFCLPIDPFSARNH